MTRYAQNTEVSVDRSISEIQRTLERYGAKQFGYAQDTDRGLASVQFAASGRHIRFVLRLPSQTERRFTHHQRGVRTKEAAYKGWEQACRQRWRALALAIKAKLEAVESGISCFEDEFMAFVVLPGGGTVGELMRPQIEQAYLSGDLPPGIAGLLPAPSDGGAS